MDIGVRGGVGEHWLFFGDHLELRGFDIEDAIAPLVAANKHPDRFHYFGMCLGDKDETRPFRFYPDNPSSSHFAASNGTDAAAIDGQWQDVQIRRLDTLFADGIVEQTDFIKMDAESYEIEIVRGGDIFFANSGVFGVESEVTFFRTPRNPRSHMAELYDELGPHGFEVYDAGIHRAARLPLARGFPQPSSEKKLRPVGRAWAFDFLFLHNAFNEPATLGNQGIDRLLKMAAVAEIYGLQDVALDILFKNRNIVGGRIDIDEASNWLVRDTSASALTYREYSQLA